MIFKMSMEDRWKFKEKCTGRLRDMVFLEWKYFSFIQDDIQGFLCYSLGNPEDILGMKRGILTYAIYHEHGECIGYLEIPKDKLDLEEEGRWVFDTDLLTRSGERSWKLKGGIPEIHWDLDYTMIAPGGTKHMDIGKKIGIDVWMDWMVFCNSADVEGDLKVGDKLYRIDGMGYYDSNLGHWIPSKTLWTWGNCMGRVKDTPISLSLGESRFGSKPLGYVYLSVGEQTHVFHKDEYTLEYDSKEPVPKEYRLKGARDDGLSIKGIFNVHRTDSIKLKAFGCIPLLNLGLQRGTMELEIVMPDGEAYILSCHGSWELPGKALKVFSG